MRGAPHTQAMKHILSATFGVLLVGLRLFGQSAQTLIIPDVADGGGWQSTIVLTNTSTNPAVATLNFHSDIGTTGATQPWSPSFLEVSSTTGMVLASGSTIYLHTPGTAAVLTQGWAELDSDVGIVAYAIFSNHQTTPYRDATSPAVAASNRILVPYNDANGFVTAIAVTNPTGASQAIQVGFRNDAGVLLTALPVVPALGHMTFVLSTQFPQIGGHLGLAEFYSATGNISILSLAFNPTQSDASAPVYFQSGPPLITAPPVTDTGDPGLMYHAPRPTGGVQ